MTEECTYSINNKKLSTYYLSYQNFLNTPRSYFSQFMLLVLLKARPKCNKCKIAIQPRKTRPRPTAIYHVTQKYLYSALIKRKSHQVLWSNSNDLSFPLNIGKDMSGCCSSGRSTVEDRQPRSFCCETCESTDDDCMRKSLLELDQRVRLLSLKSDRSRQSSARYASRWRNSS